MGSRAIYFAEFFSVGAFSYLGVFVRIELARALNQSNESTGPYSGVFTTQKYLLANVLGCFLMALLVSHKDLVVRYSRAGFVGLTAGLCGSLTTFSTWIVTCFDALFTQRNIGYFILRFAVQFSMTWSALLLGFFLARMSSNIVKVKTGGEIEMHSVSRDEEYDVEDPTDDVVAETKNCEEVCLDGHEDNTTPHEQTGTNDLKQLQLGCDCSTVMTAEGCLWLSVFSVCTLALVVALIVLESEEDVEGVASLTADRLRCLVVAPAGAWLRWSLARSPLKELWPELHLPTLIANLVAVLIASCLTEFDHNEWRQSILAGFCGSLSTVSSLFVELHNLNNNKGPTSTLRYLLLTLIPAVSIVMIILQIKKDTQPN